MVRAMKYVPLAMLWFALGCDTTKYPDVTCTTLPGGTACIEDPTLAAVRTPCGDVTQYCDPTSSPAPNLTCLTSPSLSPPATPATVTLTGFVHVFSSGPNSDKLTVQLFDAATLQSGTDPAGVTPLASLATALDPTTQRACDTDGAKGCSIPLANGCTLPVCNDGLDGRPDDQMYCRDNGAGGECSHRLRWEARYTFDNVPTNKQLVIRVIGPTGILDNVWATTVAFNVSLATDDRPCANLSDTDCLDASRATYQLNVNALSRTDYFELPVGSGLPGGISPDFGAVAGELHDCDNIRVANVQLATTPPGDRFTYFNGNPIQTLPDSTRAAMGTDRLGLFASLNVKPGAVRVETLGETTAGGALESFGTVDAFVYPNSVTIVNVNGGRRP
jgi:hypothetical protein